MKLLIDTHCWLWSLLAPERLAPRARDLVADGNTVVYLSAASAWEIAIKSALGKLRLPEPPTRFVPSRMQAQSISALSVEHRHALEVAELPLHHRDPFDRILVAQARLEEVPLLTADPQMTPYDVEIVWAAT